MIIATMDERFLQLLSASALALPMLVAGQQATFDDRRLNFLQGRDPSFLQTRPCAPSSPTGGGPKPNPPTNPTPSLEDLERYYEDHDVFHLGSARRLQGLTNDEGFDKLRPPKEGPPPPPPGLTCKTYSMSYHGEDWETPEIMGEWAQWGLHALQWKGYNHIDAGGTYDPAQASASYPPSWDYPDTVACSDADALNALEASGIYETSGSDVDPTGTWVCDAENDPHVGAVLAAMAMHYWNTPVYKDASGCPEFPGGDFWCIVAMAIERVTLCVTGDRPPHEVCGWDALDWESGQGGLGACAAQLALDSVEVGVFSDIPMCGSTTPFGPHRTIGGADWAWYYNGYGGGDTELVWDPPAGVSGDAIAAMHRMASATTEGMIAVGREGDDVKVVNVEVKKNKGRGGLFGP